MIGMAILQPVVALAAWTMVMWAWMYATRVPAVGAGMNRKLFWVRLAVSAAVDSSTTLNSMLALAPAAPTFGLLSNQTFEKAVDRGSEGDGSYEIVLHQVGRTFHVATP